MQAKLFQRSIIWLALGLIAYINAQSTFLVGEPEVAKEESPVVFDPLTGEPESKKDSR